MIGIVIGLTNQFKLSAIWNSWPFCNSSALGYKSLQSVPVKYLLSTLDTGSIYVRECFADFRKNPLLVVRIVALCSFLVNNFTTLFTSSFWKNFENPTKRPTQALCTWRLTQMYLLVANYFLYFSRFHLCIKLFCGLFQIVLYCFSTSQSHHLIFEMKPFSGLL